MATILTSCGGSAQAVVVGVLLFVCVILEITAISGNWWANNGTQASVHVSLWEVEVSPREGVTNFQDLNLNWSEYCAHEKIDKPDWCHKVRTVRAFAFLALGLHFIALFSLIVAMVIKHKRWGLSAVFCSFAGALCAFTSFSISIFYPTDSSPAVDEPGFGFVSMVCGSILGCAAFILSFCGIARKFMLTRGGDVSQGEWTAWRPQGSNYPIIVGLLVFVGVFLEGIAILGTWWVDTHTMAKVHVTLWRVVVTSQKGEFEKLSLSWSDYCSHSKIDKEDWCHMIRAVRTMTILATCFGIGAFISLTVSLTQKSNIWGKSALVTLFLSLCCGICSFSVSLFYPTKTSPAVDTPGFAFVMMCFSTLLSLLALILAAFRMLRFSSSGFKQLDANEPKMSSGSKNDHHSGDIIKPAPPPPTDNGVSPTAYGSPTYGQVSYNSETYNSETQGQSPYTSEL